MIAALPASLGLALQNWRIDGPIDVELVVGRSEDASGAEATIVRATAAMHGGRIQSVRGGPAMENAHLLATWDGVELRIPELHGNLSGGDVVGDLGVRHTDEGRIVGSGRLRATGIRLDGPLGEAMGGVTGGAWNRLDPGGVVDVSLDRIEFQRDQAAESFDWRLEGEAALQAVSVSGFGALTDATGSLGFEGTVQGEAPAMIFSGTLSLREARVSDLPLKLVTSPWTHKKTGEPAGRLTLDDVRGRLFGGTMSAQFGLVFDSLGAEYDLTARLDEMQLAEVIHALPVPTAGERPKLDEIRGEVNGYLYVSGRANDPSTRRGGGRFEIVRGYLYKLPILLAILNVLDLTVPNDEAVEQTQVEFFMVGQRMTLRDIALRGGVLALVGSGTVTLPDFAVDLHLANVTSRSWMRVPVLTDMIEGASREFVELHVTGPLSQPNVRTRPLPGLTDELKQLFQRRKPKPVEPDRQ